MKPKQDQPLLLVRNVCHTGVVSGSLLNDTDGSSWARKRIGNLASVGSSEVESTEASLRRAVAAEGDATAASLSETELRAVCTARS